MNKRLLLGITAQFGALICAAQFVVFDNSFSQDGSLTMSLGSSGGYPKSLLVQPDGRIVIVGSTTPAGQHRTISIVRLNEDGTLDTDFSFDGKVEINTMSLNLVEWYDEPVGTALQPDGKLVVVGQAGTDFYKDYLVLRINANGSIDEDFGDGGWTTTDVDGQNNLAMGMSLLPDGKILVLGEGGFSDGRHVLLRYDQAGDLDSTFGVGGIAMSPPAAFMREAYAMTVDENGMIIVAASEMTSDVSAYYLTLYRYTPEGVLDTSFDDDGLWICPRPSEDIVRTKSLWIDDNGMYCSAGLADNDSLMTLRAEPSGSLDPTYGNAGVGMFRPEYFIAGSALQDLDGGMIVVGRVGNLSDAALMRLTADGELDLDFGVNGVAVQNPVGSTDSRYEVITMDADLRWILAGNGPVGGMGNQAAVVRFLGNDATFIPPFTPSSSLRIFPNPATSEIRISNGDSGSGQSDIRIVASNGATSAARLSVEAPPNAVSKEMRVDVSMLPAGLYTVVALYDEQRVIGRFAVVPR